MYYCHGLFVPVLEIHRLLNKKKPLISSHVINFLISATPCTGFNCLNGGSCEVSNGTFHCLCKPNVTGMFCEGKVCKCLNKNKLKNKKAMLYRKKKNIKGCQVSSDYYTLAYLFCLIEINQVIC